ncbi:hypothetical protein [Sphingobacterium sp. 18053]|uniref:hypothetical protein n=1 Tax=Sphingobacterium sp. 18053 TaxID=2681401 RepID=UPI001357694D|nr:hypothetical protein [Sphingobacterium sp. 18053]
MDLLIKVLQLQLEEVGQLLSNSREDTYSDSHKQDYHKNLINLFDHLKETDFNGLTDPNQLSIYKTYLEFILSSITLLKDNTLNTIPYEMVLCLKDAMEDWINPDDYIIVTGLKKELYSFSYSLESFTELFYKDLQFKFGISFEKKLVKINLPFTLSKDYFCTVPLYHELGHFIDNQLSVVRNTVSLIINDGEFGFNHSDLHYYFPSIIPDILKVDVDTPTENLDRIMNCFINHLAEYFCDIFASQYIGINSNIYINYISFQYGNSESYTHPDTKLRMEMVETFLSGKTNRVIELLINSISQLSGQILRIRYKTIESDDFYHLIPFEASCKDELHGIFDYGWRTWLNSKEKFIATNGDSFQDITQSNYYNIINNLVEKSIGNYFINKNWKENK